MACEQARTANSPSLTSRNGTEATVASAGAPRAPSPRPRRALARGGGASSPTPSLPERRFFASQVMEELAEVGVLERAQLLPPASLVSGLATDQDPDLMSGDEHE